jgi:hypothetical protein
MNPRRRGRRAASCEGSRRTQPMRRYTAVKFAVNGTAVCSCVKRSLTGNAIRGRSFTRLLIWDSNARTLPWTCGSRPGTSLDNRGERSFARTASNLSSSVDASRYSTRSNDSSSSMLLLGRLLAIVENEIRIPFEVTQMKNALGTGVSEQLSPKVTSRSSSVSKKLGYKVDRSIATANQIFLGQAKNQKPDWTNLNESSPRRRLKNAQHLKLTTTQPSEVNPVARYY